MESQSSLVGAQLDSTLLHDDNVQLQCEIGNANCTDESTNALAGS